uniref:F-box domain-containing protein n=1 Tax=Tanacetum cinerariifolium TaxID=118510 RepID=A0A699HZ19_TANCI|nr:F-box domain-containing protein [Tanacetum cinerariifolium]
MLFGFGVHPVTLDPTVLKMNYPYYGQGPWYVSVFTLSSRTWYKLESYCLPRESIRIKRSCQAVVGGKILWVGSEKFYGDDGIPYKLYMLVLFDLITHQFQLSSSTRIEPSSSTSNPVRIIPGLAGLVQRAKLLKENVFILDPDGALMSSQEYMHKVVEDVGEDADFNGGAWVSATNYVIAFDGIVTGCWGDIDNFLKKGKLEQVVAIVKSCYPNALGDLNVTLKDVSGAAMILANVSVFTPKPSEHYFNITKRNVVEPCQNYYGCKFFLWKEERVGLLINSPRGSSTTTFSQATSTSPSLSPTPSTTPFYYRGSSTNTECSNCKHLLGRIKVLQATLEMYRPPEQHTLKPAALLHNLNNDMEKLGLE